MPREFLLPDLGEGIAEAQVIRVLIKQGEDIAEDQYLMEVETDKAAVEIPSPFAGIAKTVHVKEGEIVNVGDVIVTFDDGESADAAQTAAAAPAEKSRPVAEAAPSPASAPAVKAKPTAARTQVAAAPVVRRLAREMGIDLTTIQGTGPGGRITKEDVVNHGSSAVEVAPAASVATPITAATVPSLAPPMPLTRGAGASIELPAGADESDKYGAVRRVAITQIRKTIANRMVQSAFTAVHVSQGDEADITQLERLRQEVNKATGNDPKLTVMTFVIRAVCIALRNHPIFNAAFDESGGAIIYKRYVHLGIAVDSDRGLIVPVIRDCDQLTMRGIAYKLREIADRIRSNQFAIEDLRGGTFTITNIGALGGTFSTPIINYPEVAILGLGRSKKVPVFREGTLEEALILPLNLSFDHRVMDGANAARFTTDIKSYLETPAKFLLD